MKDTKFSRRKFVKFGVLSPLMLSMGDLVSVANAQSGADSDYRALVCVYMGGGNDSHNTVVATDSESYSQYFSVRGQGGAQIALPAGSLIPISDRNSQALNTGRSFALHPELTELARLWSLGHIAIVPNVGPLIRPVTRAQILSGTAVYPQRLYSHNDQTSTWLTFKPEGAHSGWGGLIADSFQNSSYPQLSSISLTSRSAWATSINTQQFQLAPNANLRLSALHDGFFNPAQLQVLRELMFTSTNAPFEQEWQRVLTNSIQLNTTISSAVASQKEVPAALGSYNGLASRFRTVLQGMLAAKEMGIKRQIYSISVPGTFDNHSDLLSSLIPLYRTINDGFKYFYENLEARGMLNNVTTFTASEFGRTLKCNGTGSDHGWGGHHFVMGGAVNGGELWGRFPNVGLGTEDDAGGGALIPSISVEQYGATFAKWMGLTIGQIASVFPNLQNFGGNTDLGFLRS